MTTILTPHSNCMGIFDVAETGLLVDSCDYYRAFYHTARQARHYLLLAGWQFDSEVRLLRGSDAEAAEGDVRLLPFLEKLCERTPELQIYILAWDFSMIFSLEREWFQNLIFDWTTHERLHFRLDNRHASGATHHQKFVIADGALAFLGGMDICSDRWDDRSHAEENPLRTNTDGVAYGAYHDIQTYHTGPLVEELVRLFQERWMNAGEAPLDLPRVAGNIRLPDTGILPLAADMVAVSRTYVLSSTEPAAPVREIRRLFIDAIMAADRLIYMENQYFSSQAVLWALEERMRATDRPLLQIVLILPDRLPFTEELFIGMQQMKMLRSLQRVAEETGHRFGVFSTACIKEGQRKMTFIHSKLLLVDDRFLTIGSANTTNRSMGLDSELNVSWEADPREQPELVASIRTVRASLLAEHIGYPFQAPPHVLEQVDGLTDTLNHLANDNRTRLCRYLPELPLENGALLEALHPVTRVVDPEKPLDSEFMFEYLSERETSLFAKGILLLSQWIAGM